MKQGKPKSLGALYHDTLALIQQSAKQPRAIPEIGFKFRMIARQPAGPTILASDTTLQSGPSS